MPSRRQAGKARNDRCAGERADANISLIVFHRNQEIDGVYSRDNAIKDGRREGGKRRQERKEEAYVALIKLRRRGRRAILLHWGTERRTNEWDVGRKDQLELIIPGGGGGCGL